MLPLSKIGEQHSGGESLSADSNAFKHTITSQLMQHKLPINDTGCFLLVGDDATDEMRGGGKQSLHQPVQLFLVTETDSLEGRSLLLFATYWSRKIDE